MADLYFIDPGVPFPRPDTNSDPDAPTAPETPHIDPDMPGGKPLTPEPDMPGEPEPEPELPEPDSPGTNARAYNDV